MINKANKIQTKNKRTERNRYKLRHISDRLRLVLVKTNRYLIAQVIDDQNGKTLVNAISSEKEIPGKGYNRKNKESASSLGKLIAKRAIDKGIKQVKLDRSGNRYHGKVAAFADSAREGGLEF